MLSGKGICAFRMVKWMVMLAMALALAGTWSVAVAQGLGGGRLDAAKMEAAWKLEAQGVAKDLGLADDLAAKLVTAYSDSRKSMQGAAQKAMGGVQQGTNPYQAYQKLAEEERGKLKTAVSGFLNAEQTDKAVAVLGTFNRQWDMMVDALAGMNLPAEKMDKALNAVSKYVVDVDKARADAMAKGDRESAREAMQKLRGELETGLGGILSADELAKFKEATVFRGGRRGERRGNEGGAAPAPGAGAAEGSAPK